MGIILATLWNITKTISSIITLLRTLSDDFNQALKRASQSPGLPNPEPTLSYWFKDPPFPELVDVRSPKLRQTADVAIIGSGIAGAAIARSLLHERQRHNPNDRKKIIVFEARQLCSGATGRNGGHIKASPHESFARISKIFGKDRAAALVRFQNRHLDCLIGLCRSAGIEAAEARKVETVDFFLDERSFQKAIREVDEIKSLVPEVHIAVWDGPKAQEVCHFRNRCGASGANMNRNLVSTEALPVLCPMKQARCGPIDSLCPYGKISSQISMTFYLLRQTLLSRR